MIAQTQAVVFPLAMKKGAPYLLSSLFKYCEAELTRYPLLAARFMAFSERYYLAGLGIFSPVLEPKVP